MTRMEKFLTINHNYILTFMSCKKEYTHIINKFKTPQKVK